MRKRTSAASLHEALRLRFAAPEWAYLDEVRNGTGYARRETRTADAIAMSLWPSRGLELHGIEIKSDRADWLREKNNPAKADAIGKYCDRWWLAIGDASVAPLDEVPAPWGLLVFADGGLVCARLPSPLPSPLPIDRLLLAALLRKATAACDQHVHRDEVAKESESLIAEARAGGLAAMTHEQAMVRRDAEELRERIERFEKASGVEIDRFRPDLTGAAVRALVEHGPERIRQSAEHTRNCAAAVMREAEALMAALDGAT